MAMRVGALIASTRAAGHMLELDAGHRGELLAPKPAGRFAP
jgi:hypothetical protein